MPIVTGALYPSWVTVHFARPYDLKEATIGFRLRAIQPTVREYSEYPVSTQSTDREYSEYRP